MSELYDKYAFVEVRNILQNELKNLLADELESLYRDFSQSFDQTQVNHEIWRLLKELKENYKTWQFADVHTAFQYMLDKSVNSYRKVTVQSLFFCLKHTRDLKQRQASKTGGEYVKNESTPEQRAEFAKAGAYYGPYIRWWMQYNVDPKQVSVHMYNEAKENNQLQTLTDMWRDSRQMETEGMTFVRNINKPKKLREVV